MQSFHTRNLGLRVIMAYLKGGNESNALVKDKFLAEKVNLIAQFYLFN